MDSTVLMVVDDETIE